MKLTELSIELATVLPAVIVFVELFLFLPIVDSASAVKNNAAKALKLMRAHGISDHWKEKVMMRYATLILAASLKNAIYLSILVLSFSLAFFLTGILFYENLAAVTRRFVEPRTQIMAIGLGIVYAVLRKKLSGRKSKAEYSIPSKILHHLALDSDPIKKVAFDIDCQIARTRRQPTKVEKPVFVTGLARSGTTILLEAIYSTGMFATLTYRDMPFVTAPLFWKLLTSKNQKQTDLKERAHADRLKINYDSPEAFEEVFWMAFTGEDYIKKNWLEIHEVDEQGIQAYKKYVSNIITGSGEPSQTRYLAKNNNNLLRIDSLKKAFPDAIILAPFRNPLDHAKSLQTQHERFIKTHNEDAFSLRYMNWLGHHEFGLNFKPFKVSDEVLPQYEGETGILTYWVRYWTCVYEYLLNNHVSNAVFFDYDRFCVQPAEILEGLTANLSLESSLIKEFQAKVKPAIKYEYVEMDWELLGYAKEIHKALIKISSSYM